MRVRGLVRRSCGRHAGPASPELRGAAGRTRHRRAQVHITKRRRRGGCEREKKPANAWKLNPNDWKETELSDHSPAAVRGTRFENGREARLGRSCRRTPSGIATWWWLSPWWGPCARARRLAQEAAEQLAAEQKGSARRLSASKKEKVRKNIVTSLFRMEEQWAMNRNVLPASCHALRPAPLVLLTSTIGPSLAILVIENVHVDPFGLYFLRAGLANLPARADHADEALRPTVPGEDQVRADDHYRRGGRISVYSGRAQGPPTWLGIVSCGRYA